MLQILDTRMGSPSPSLNVVFDYFSHSCLKMCKLCLKRTLDATFLDCLALTFCDVISELLPEWDCLTLQGGTTFLLTSKLADVPVSRMRKHFPRRAKFGYRSVSSGRKHFPRRAKFGYRSVSSGRNSVLLSIIRFWTLIWVGRWGSGGGRVVKLLACRARGPGFDSRPCHSNFQKWLSPASKSRYDWNTAEAT